MPLRLVPVSERKRSIIGSPMRKAKAVSSSITTESTKRSVTTVPSDCVKDVPSYFFSVPHRVTSPTRGTTRLAAYDIKTASTHVPRRTGSPSGSIAIFQRRARSTCGTMPKRSESDIGSQKRASATQANDCAQSVPRYIHHSMPRPKTKGNAMRAAPTSTFLRLKPAT